MVLGTLVLGIAIAKVRCIWAVRYRVEYVGRGQGWRRTPPADVPISFDVNFLLQSEIDTWVSDKTICQMPSSGDAYGTLPKCAKHVKPIPDRGLVWHQYRPILWKSLHNQQGVPIFVMSFALAIGFVHYPCRWQRDFWCEHWPSCVKHVGPWLMWRQRGMATPLPAGSVHDPESWRMRSGRILQFWFI